MRVCFPLCFSCCLKAFLACLEYLQMIWRRCNWNFMPQRLLSNCLIPRKTLKLEYQLLADVVEKSLIAKTGHLYSDHWNVPSDDHNNERHEDQVVLHSIQYIEDMVSQSKQSFLLSIWEIFLKTSKFLSTQQLLHKYRMLNSQNIVVLKLKGQALNISPAGLLTVEKYWSRFG